MPAAALLRPRSALLVEHARRAAVLRQRLLPTFGVAGAATLLGYWPVLPFAGAEMVLLGWALHSNMQRRFEHETIDVSETEVVIEFLS